MPSPYGRNLHLEPGISGLDLAAALVGWLQRECGAVAGEYDLEGNVVSIPLQVRAGRLVSAGTWLHARLTRARSEELFTTAEELFRRFEARHHRIRALLAESGPSMRLPAAETIARFLAADGCHDPTTATTGSVPSWRRHANCALRGRPRPG